MDVISSSVFSLGHLSSSPLFLLVALASPTLLYLLYVNIESITVKYKNIKCTFLSGIFYPTQSFGDSFILAYASIVLFIVK